MMETDSVIVVNDLLHQAAQHLDHRQTVGGLHPRALQPVVEQRVFVGDQVQLGGVPHHLDADVARVLVGQQRIGVVGGAGENVAQHRDGELSRHQPPQGARNRLMLGKNLVDRCR